MIWNKSILFARKNIIIPIIPNCFFYKTAICSSTKSNYKQARCLNKLLVPKKARKKFTIYGEVKSDGLSIDPMFSFNSKNKRRISVLNKLFMKHITDLMATGSVSEALNEHAIEVTMVSVGADYNFINVFWSSEKDNIAIEALLPTLAITVRHELSQLKYMGLTPKIKFIKDNRNSKIAQVENLLENADFGDETTINEEDSVKHTVKNVKTIESNIYSLDYDKIMIKIKRSMSKSSALHRVKDQN